MKTSISSCLAIAALWLFGGCADWFEPDTCGPPLVRVELTPSPQCLQLSGTAGTGSGQIIGTNYCADPLIVQSLFTDDGGASTTFPAGAQVLIPLDESGAVHNGVMESWEVHAVLGTQTIVITMTKAPC
jgi:hypothetical protein